MLFGVKCLALWILLVLVMTCFLCVFCVCGCLLVFVSLYLWLFVVCILGVVWVSYLADLLWLTLGFDLWLLHLVCFCGFWYLYCVKAVGGYLG